MATKGIIAVVLLLLVGYGLIEARHLIAGPSIHLTIPANYTSSSDGFVYLEGTAKNTENLALNGGPLLMDESGNFRDRLLLPKGGAILTFTATDRFGRTSTLTRTIYIL